MNGIIVTGEYAILALQEVKHGDLATLDLQGGWKVTLSKGEKVDGKGHHAAIACKKEVEKEWRGNRTVAVRIKGGLVVVSVYMPITSGGLSAADIRPHLEEIKAAVKDLRLTRTCPLVVMGDFNTTHTVWDMRKKTNNKEEVGEAILDTMEELGLVMLTTPDEFTFKRGKGRSVIDLTFISKKWDDAFIFADQESVIDDHVPISVLIQDISEPDEMEISQRIDEISDKYDLRLVDWKLYCTTLEQEGRSKLSNDLNIDGKWEAIHSSIKLSLFAAGGVAIGTKPGTSFASHDKKNQHKDGAGPALPYWNSKCQEAAARVLKMEHESRARASVSLGPLLARGRKERRAQLERLTRKDPLVLDAQREERKEISIAEDEYINQTVNEIGRGGHNAWETVGRLLGKKKNKQEFTYLQKDDGSLTTNVNESASILANSFFPGSKKCPEVSINEERTVLDEVIARNRGVQNVYGISPQEEDEEQDITDVEFDEALKADGDNSPGFDGFPLRVIKEGYANSPTFRHNVLSLYNQCFRESRVPFVWKKAVVTAVLKPNRSPTLAKSYRPISLLPIVAKLLERIMASRLQYFGTAREKLSKGHQGGIVGRSAEEALIAILSAAKDMTLLARAIMGIDVTGAFNNVNVDVLSQVLHDKLDVISGCKVANFCKEWGKDRMFSLKANGGLIGGWRTQDRGLPQGSPLSPILWAFYVDDLVRELEELDEPFAQVKVVAYVDDINCVLSSTSWTGLARKAKQVKLVMENWARRKSIGLAKGTLMPIAAHFTRYQKGARILEGVGRVGDHDEENPSAIDDEISILGITMDRKLFMIPHIRKKVIVTIRMVRRLHHLKLTPRTKMHIVKTILRPSLEYGLSCILPLTSAATNLLERADAVMLCWVLGSNAHKYGQFGREVCWVETGSSTPEYRIWSHARRMIASRSDAELCIPSSDQMTLSWKRNRYKTAYDIITEGVIAGEGKSLEAPWKWRKSTFDSTEIAGSKDDAAVRHHEMTVDFKGVVVYTDGSLTSNGAGSGAVIIFQSGRHIEISESAGRMRGVFGSEMRAIGKAAEVLLSEGLTSETTIRLFSDSQACLKSLQQVQKWVTRGIRTDTVKAIDDLQCRVEAYWLPGHRGIEGNEWADVLAGRAAESSTFHDNGIVPIKENIEKVSRIALRTKIDEMTSKSLSKFLDFENMMSGSPYWSLPGYLVSRRVRWFTGHAFKRPISQGLKCQCEELLFPSPEEHILLKCPRTARSRNELDIIQGADDQDVDNYGWLRRCKNIDKYLQFAEDTKAAAKTSEMFLEELASDLFNNASIHETE